jgi:hypothetical protein
MLVASVVAPDSACHAEGRGFESRRSRRKALETAYFVVAPENTIEARAANGQERDERGAVVGAEADASLPGS